MTTRTYADFSLDNSDTTSPEPSSMSLGTERKSKGQGLNSASTAGKFMSNENQLDLLLRAEDPLDRVPNGNTDDVYVVIKHSNGKSDAFPDDRGVWDNKKQYDMCVQTQQCVLYKKGC